MSSSTALFLFRRDFRVRDNTALEATTDRFRTTIPLFFLIRTQADPAANAYGSRRAVRFMLRSLVELARRDLPDLTVVLCEDEDDAERALMRVVERTRSAAVAYNADVTPYAARRDDAIAEACSRRGIEIIAPRGDTTLVDPAAMDRPYQRFTPFYARYAETARPPSRRRAAAAAFGTCPSDALRGRSFLRPGRNAADAALLSTAFGVSSDDDTRAVEPGRAAAKRLLARIERGDFATYATARDRITDPRGSTRLSAYLKFGCISVREALAAARRSTGPSADLQREMFWRAFYDQVAFHFPHVLRGQVGVRGRSHGRHGPSRTVRAAAGDANESLRRAYDRVDWDALVPSAAERRRRFAAWCEGVTGFPLVDAGMRELVSTGFMHNRVRMLVASVLIKTLHIDWRLGERFFAKHLVDYHPPANSGGWQWVSGGGADAQQYTRVFSPWRQAARHDPQCEYIRQHVPELRGFDAAAILAWGTREDETGYENGRAAYPRRPIVDHAKQRRLFLDALRNALASGENYVVRV